MFSGRVPPPPRDLIAHLTVRDLDTAVAYYERVFGARELRGDALSGERPAIAELVFGDVSVLVGEESVHYDYSPSPASLGGSPVLLTLRYDDPAPVFEAAIEAGGEVELPLEGEPGGERYGIVRDIEGHRWALVSVRQAQPDAAASSPAADIAQGADSAERGEQAVRPDGPDASDAHDGSADRADRADVSEPADAAHRGDQEKLSGSVQ
ncbi:Uncharacterized conserved protein PhnB, glyoxalase superfamily [Sinosporangium album]|uniref:Uncharacterized conserved protein PhnB, glyoxalase superfamily n=1 Tax=Sinosporangium album TaxID=504805 RepID=A0A1G8B4D1_9ACTN|nr:VOC family protein [Sinosporangium album]SDH27500.1 Uncharacterized conserved protein PhnB, glyoxalase superfamily [Sinosporangium album]